MLHVCPTDATQMPHTRHSAANIGQKRKRAEGCRLPTLNDAPASSSGGQIAADVSRSGEDAPEIVSGRQSPVAGPVRNPGE